MHSQALLLSQPTDLWVAGQLLVATVCLGDAVLPGKLLRSFQIPRRNCCYLNQEDGKS